MNINNYRGLLATLLISFALSISGIPDAEAKRFGSSRSFGGKSSYNSPFRKSASPKRSVSQQKAFQKNQATRQNMGRRGGFMGMLGGLALGGLLGAMLFGGAFEGINFMDILMFGGIAFLLLKLFSARKNPGRQPVYSENNTQQVDYLSGSNTSQRNSANFDTNILFDKNGHNDKFSKANFHNHADLDEKNIHPGFDKADFLDGAKNAFFILQKAWDEHDLTEIRALTTDKVFAEIQQQLKDSPEINQTDVLKLDAELLSIRELGTDLEAVVLFDSIIREDTNNQAQQVREVWHFTKNKNSSQPKWSLDGIQQLEQ